MSRTIPIIALILSIVAVVIAIVAHRAADDRAAAVIRQRELALIETLKPQLDQLYADFGLTPDPSAQHPQTIEELLEPMFRLTTSVQKPQRVP